MSCSCCAQCQAELRDAKIELGRALVERDHATLERDHLKELLADAKLDLASMAQGTRVEDLEPGEDWAAKHCNPEPEPDTSERDFRRALVVAALGGVLANSSESGKPHVGWVVDVADAVADEQLRRERGGK